MGVNIINKKFLGAFAFNAHPRKKEKKKKKKKNFKSDCIVACSSNEMCHAKKEITPSKS